MKAQYNASGNIDHYTTEKSGIEYDFPKQNNAVKIIVAVIFFVMLCAVGFFLLPLF